MSVIKSRLRPKLSFDNVDAAITDLETLRRQGCVQRGQWSLSQACWHIHMVIDDMTQPATSTEPTDRERAVKAGLVAKMSLPGGPSNLDAQPGHTPPADADPSAVDAAIAGLRKIATWPDRFVKMGPLGPAPLAEAVGFHLGHVAHHLSFLAPRAQRRQGLRYASVDDAIADVQHLRDDGYAQAGNWTLEQICWHLDVATRKRLAPPPYPPTTPEQAAKRDVFAQVLATGQLPPGLEATDEFVPPADADATAITALIDTLGQVKSHKGPFAPHRRFGHMSDDESRQQILIHTAHHLSHLVSNK